MGAGGSPYSKVHLSTCSKGRHEQSLDSIHGSGCLRGRTGCRVSSISNAAAVRFGRDWAAERAAITGMISVTPEDVIISGFKRSEDAAGYIVRLREMNGHPTTASLKIPALRTIKRACLANGVEDTVKELAVLDEIVSVPLEPWDVVTLKIE